MPPFLKRTLAFGVDYLLILLYAGGLFGLVMLLQAGLGRQLGGLAPVPAQVLGFFTLTLPVYLYFYLTERSSHKGTLGKRLFRLGVEVADESQRNRRVLLRNLYKFLPWEVAHTGVHWQVWYEGEAPLWVWVLSTLPMLVVVIYYLSVVSSGGRSSVYDRAAGTWVVNERRK